MKERFLDLLCHIFFTTLARRQLPLFGDKRLFCTRICESGWTRMQPGVMFMKRDAKMAFYI